MKPDLYSENRRIRFQHWSKSILKELRIVEWRHLHNPSSLKSEQLTAPSRGSVWILTVPSIPWRLWDNLLLSEDLVEVESHRGLSLEAILDRSCWSLHAFLYTLVQDRRSIPMERHRRRLCLLSRTTQGPGELRRTKGKESENKSNEKSWKRVIEGNQPNALTSERGVDPKENIDWRRSCSALRMEDWVTYGWHKLLISALARRKGEASVSWPLRPLRA